MNSLFAILLAVLVVVGLIGAYASYLRRRRKEEALRIGRYRQRLEQWEKEGYDVSEFKKKWFDNIYAVTERKWLPWVSSFLIVVAVAALSIGGWSGAAGHFPPWAETGSVAVVAPSTPTPTPTLMPSPTPTATPRPTLSPTPAVELPPGMSAFVGRVVWGDKPVTGGDVVADTKHPAVEIPPWESYASQYKQFSTQTDQDGRYVLIVEPESYYIACGLPNSQYLTYETIGENLIMATAHSVESGEVVAVDLEAVDWSIELISPGEPWYEFTYEATEKSTSTNPPWLVWKDYEWDKYGQETGYYVIELGIIKDGYHEVLRAETEEPFYAVQDYLEEGEYRWRVQAYTQGGNIVAGNSDDLYFRPAVD